MKKFFAAANTEEGFHSLFDEVFSPETFRRIYILKGGPGTGKSTMMGRIGFIAESKGYETEYICCSSDPRSLDGVIIPALSVAVLDGTAPHTADPVYPGAVERIVDLGAAFDFPRLEEKREVLVPLIRAKKEAYRTAYRFLSAAGRLEDEREDLLRSFYLAEKADAAAKRLVASFRRLRRGADKRRYISSICAEGYFRLDTLSAQAKKVYAVTDKNGFGYLFMDTLYRRLSAERFAMTVCPSPLSKDRKEAIFLEGEDVLFLISDDGQAALAEKTVNSMRFADREALARKRQRLRFLEKCRSAVLDGAVSCFAEAVAIHEKTERIYGGCVDFAKVDVIIGKKVDEIFANNV